MVYAKDAEKAKTLTLPRSESANARYRNPYQDPEGLWREHDLTARTPDEKAHYAIQSPFTGKLYYPPGTRSWCEGTGASCGGGSEITTRVSVSYVASRGGRRLSGSARATFRVKAAPKRRR